MSDLENSGPAAGGEVPGGVRPATFAPLNESDPG